MVLALSYVGVLGVVLLLHYFATRSDARKRDEYRFLQGIVLGLWIAHVADAPESVIESPQRTLVVLIAMAGGIILGRWITRTAPQFQLPTNLAE